MRRLPALAGAFGAALLSACGQTGPLYLPEDEGATVITRPGPGTSAAPPATPAVPPAAPGTAAPPAQDVPADGAPEPEKPRESSRPRS